MYNWSQTIRGAREGYAESGNAQSLIETPQCCISLALSSETFVIRSCEAHHKYVCMVTLYNHWHSLKFKSFQHCLDDISISISRAVNLGLALIFSSNRSMKPWLLTGLERNTFSETSRTVLS